ncbi:hypothetical protein [Actinomycetospora straminea]|uniref:hypothetical protein n=1 Tax=Actinomycetospora straminea TaxID=663607 RepID=UPI0023660E9E|nr:hypothetical protein [Actinomycetospora straminea]MDD7930937.1 hypothetical protein [Actinomycetospora straminea]
MTAEPDGGVHDGAQERAEDRTGDAGPAADATAADATTADPTPTSAADPAATGATATADEPGDAESRPEPPEPVVPAPRAASGAVPAADRTPATGQDPEPVTEDEAAVPSPVPDEPAGGRLTARMREARERLEPEETVIPAPRTPQGVVPPAVFGRAGAAPAELVGAVDQLVAELAHLEGGSDDDPDRRALLRALDLSASGVPEAGWSTGLAADDLAGAVEIATTLHEAAELLLGRLDAEERAASAVEVDAVVTALRVARVVLDLEAFARHGR